MNIALPPTDLVVLVADNTILSAIDGIIGRYQSLGIRPISPKILVHQNRDPGCFLEAHDFLRPYLQQFRYAMVIFDKEGCGSHADSRQIIEADVETRLELNGWSERSIALVLDPELESWVWKDCPQVEHALGWQGKVPRLRDWLYQSGWIHPGELTPRRPKEAMEDALKTVRKPRSSSIYAELARTVGFADCSDPAFLKLRNTLQTWFPAN